MNDGGGVVSLRGKLTLEEGDLLYETMIESSRRLLLSLEGLGVAFWFITVSTNLHLCISSTA